MGLYPSEPYQPGMVAHTCSLSTGGVWGERQEDPKFKNIFSFQKRKGKRKKKKKKKKVLAVLLVNFMTMQSWMLPVQHIITVSTL